MKAFITGATGFIGSYVVKRLAQTEHEMRCLVRKTSNVRELQELGATLIEGDVTDKDSLLTGMKGCDWVLNLANVYSFWEPNKRVYRDINVKGTQNVMECALETGVSKVVHVSTLAIFGKPAEGPITEETTVGPVRFSEYARTKYQGDLLAWDMHKEKGLPLVVIYPCGVYGPGDTKFSGEMIKRLMDRKMPIKGFHDCVYTGVHVRDVAEVIIRAAEKENNIGERYIAGKEQFSMHEFLEMVSEIAEVPLPRIRLPDSAVMINAAFLTGLANLTKKPPMWGLSLDGARTMKQGFRADGSKAERELGITYTPIRVALEEAIESFKR